LVALVFSVPLHAETEGPNPKCAEEESRARPVAVAPEQLENQQAKVGQIRIIGENIFDLCIPQEDRWLYRMANAIHITTKPYVIEAQLLLAPGDTYSKQRVEESERLLRSNRYLKDAEITPRQYQDGTVDLDVRTKDVWTLVPSIKFGRSGGVNTGGVALREFNLLGRGKSIAFSYQSEVDRDSTTLRYFDRNLLASRYRLLAEYSDTSDGFAQQLNFAKPFYALDVRRAGGFAANNVRQTESVYDLGKITSAFEHSFDRYSAYLGWSPGLQNNWVRRLTTGVAYDNHEFGPPPDSLYPTTELPPDREFLYPYIGMQWLSNDFEKTRNFDHMNRVEDRYLGRHFSFRIGYSSVDAGSTANAWHLSGGYGDTVYRSSSSTVVLSGQLAGRVEEGTAQNMKLIFGGRYDIRLSPKQLFHVGMTGTYGVNLDLDNPTYLGGDNGLRGYPLRYQSGDKSLLVTLEQRIFTDWYPFRIFNIGAAVFLDTGRTWGDGPSDNTNLGWLSNVGAGLRIGNTRSSIGSMLHIDLAFPLNGEDDISNVQLVIKAKAGF